MDLHDDQFKKLKEIDLEILKEFIYICDKLHLKYYILGGTLLGAIRHKGFIPWDDDIDVGLLRADYEIFIDKAQDLMKDKYFLQTYKTDKEFPANFAKIRNSNTTFIESAIGHCKINHGAFIDIFPLDYYPNKISCFFILKKKLLTLRITYAYNNKILKNKIKIARIISKFVYPSIVTAIQKREKLYKSIENGSRIANYSGTWGKREIVPKEWYGEGAEVLFEGIKVMAPKEYDKWLTQVYGDYMTLPPVEKRKSHHFTDVIDLEHPYTYYTKKR